MYENSGLYADKNDFMLDSAVKFIITLGNYERLMSNGAWRGFR